MARMHVGVGDSNWAVSARAHGSCGSLDIADPRPSTKFSSNRFGMSSAALPPSAWRRGLEGGNYDRSCGVYKVYFLAALRKATKTRRDDLTHQEGLPPLSPRKPGASPMTSFTGLLEIELPFLWCQAHPRVLSFIDKYSDVIACSHLAFGDAYCVVFKTRDAQTSRCLTSPFTAFESESGFGVYHSISNPRPALLCILNSTGCLQPAHLTWLGPLSVSFRLNSILYNTRWTLAPVPSRLLPPSRSRLPGCCRTPLKLPRPPLPVYPPPWHARLSYSLQPNLQALQSQQHTTQMLLLLVSADYADSTPRLL